MKKITWLVLRQKIFPFLFQVTNFVFIAIIQNIVRLPDPHSRCSPPLAKSDYSPRCHCNCNSRHWIHGRQPHDSKKYDPQQHWFGARLNWQPQDAERGFCTKGLWAFSRHPNFAFEQASWVCNSFKYSFISCDYLNEWTQVIITVFPILAPDSPCFDTFSSLGFRGRDLQDHFAHLGFQFLPVVRHTRKGSLCSAPFLRSCWESCGLLFLVRVKRIWIG